MILDVDTGIDDALALLLAVRHPGVNLRAVTCVAGNASLEQVVRNTLTVLDAAGAGDIPVAAGAHRPLLSEAHSAAHVHGADGLGDLGLPESPRTVVPLHAVELLRREILASPTPVTLVPLAPMTNIALLVRLYPEVLDNVERIVFMGGSASVGNATAVAEFNTWHDPEAAEIVLTSGAPITMYGLDVFYAVTIPPEDIVRLAASSEPGTQLAGRLLQHLVTVKGSEVRVAGDGHGDIGDAGAVCAAIDPEGLSTAHLPVRVSLADPLTRGQTVVDHRTAGHDQAGAGDPLFRRIDVALGIDSARYAKLFLDTITR
ncbi:nucleoside hydrolase [Salinibacterium sp. NSLL150]|nr:nucleoside hydrolase [Salinibacterium sp. NSLL35]MBH0101558.1 nucleoside hydrolase [Salinibacterium sp. NSLL150]MBH0104317.1 nucleoside hydrolase [Salinibacterium sp. NSLL16]MBH0107078.1 nucleoside hydrolase [Salinibacterium sp. NSLL17]